GGEQPDRVLVLAEAGSDLAEGIKAPRDEDRVAALGAHVQVCERVLPGDRPVAAAGGQAPERQPRVRAEEAVAQPFAALLRPPCGLRGRRVTEQPLRLGEQAERA